MAKPLTSWLVPSFLQHNLPLVVSERCLHVSVTKFWHKFASLQQVKLPPVAETSFKIAVQTCIWKDFYRILRYFASFCEIRRISRIYLNFVVPQPCKISEALDNWLFICNFEITKEQSDLLTYFSVHIIYNNSCQPARNNGQKNYGKNSWRIAPLYLRSKSRQKQINV